MFTKKHVKNMFMKILKIIKFWKISEPEVIKLDFKWLNFI